MLGFGQTQPGTRPPAGVQWKKAGQVRETLSQALEKGRAGVWDTEPGSVLAQTTALTDVPCLAHQIPRGSRARGAPCSLFAICWHLVGWSWSQAHTVPKNLQCSLLCSCTSAFQRCSEQRMKPAVSLAWEFFISCFYFTVPCALVFQC